MSQDYISDKRVFSAVVGFASARLPFLLTMEPFHAKLVAAAAGSTLTGLTSSVYSFYISVTWFLTIAHRQ